MMTRLQNAFLLCASQLPHKLAVESVVTSCNSGTETLSAEQCTYSELSLRARQVASVLNTLHIKCNECVGLYCLPSVPWVVGIIGILLNDNVYVPVDPLLSEERILQLLEHCEPLQLLLVQKELWAERSHLVMRIADRIGCGVMLLPAQVNDDFKMMRECRPRSASQSQLNRTLPSARTLAYVMFTSGTTRNTPTTVYVPHQSVLSNIESFKSLLFPVEATAFDWSLRMAAVAPLGFDPSIIDIFLPLSVGGAVVIPSSEIKLRTDLFALFMCQYRINTLQCTPSFLRRLPLDFIRTLLRSEMSSLRYLFLGGEPFPCVAEWRLWLPKEPPTPRIFNLYGITEVSVWALIEEVFSEQLRYKPLHYQISLGLPLKDTEVILCVKSRRAHDEFVSEFINLNEMLSERSRRKELKRKRFLAKTLASSLSSPSLSSSTEEKQTRTKKTVHVLQGRLYVGGPNRVCLLNSMNDSGERWRDTGDDVRVVNGKIYFVGRSDFVVKIYGKRVNPVEVATTLKCCPLFSDVVVLSHSAPDSNVLSKPIIVAWIIPADPTLTESELTLRARAYSREHLPDYMRPDYYVRCNSFPTNLNGKIDLSRLLNETKKLFEDTRQNKSEIQLDIISKETVANYLRELWAALLNISSTLSDVK
jgi:acyl-CoA synthetase (AMP-forming)/AMP-acid ligase II